MLSAPSTIVVALSDWARRQWMGPGRSASAKSMTIGTADFAIVGEHYLTTTAGPFTRARGVTP
jgi:hypothetical protein